MLEEYMENRVFDLMKWAQRELERSEVPCARKDAETLLRYTLTDRDKNIYALAGVPLPQRRLALFRHRVRLRASRFPMQYILKNTEFMGLVFMLERGVFIPRPETELLVERVLEYINSQKQKKRLNILEIGTGCGNIAISLTKHTSNCRIISSDISEKALRTALQNAVRHGVAKKVKFVKSNYFDGISSIYHNYFDIIVSNPPYIRSAEIRRLQPELGYEDIKALDGGEDGLTAYRRILREGIKFIKRGGLFAFEIGYDQRNDIIRMINKDGRFAKPCIFNDYNGFERILFVTYGAIKR